MRVYKVQLPLQPGWSRLRVLKGIEGLLYVAEVSPEEDIPGGSLRLWYFVDDIDKDGHLPNVQVAVFSDYEVVPDDAVHVGSVVTWRGRNVYHVFARDDHEENDYRQVSTTGRPLTQEEKVASRKRWDARFEEGQRRQQEVADAHV